MAWDLSIFIIIEELLGTILIRRPVLERVKGFPVTDRS